MKVIPPSKELCQRMAALHSRPPAKMTIEEVRRQVIQHREESALQILGKQNGDLPERRPPPENEQKQSITDYRENGPAEKAKATREGSQGALEVL